MNTGKRLSHTNNLINYDSWNVIISYSLNDELDENSEPLMLQSSISPNINKRLLTSKTANSLLGLSILLNGNRREYVKWPVDNHASNNYFGFKVRNLRSLQ